MGIGTFSSYVLPCDEEIGDLIENILKGMKIIESGVGMRVPHEEIGPHAGLCPVRQGWDPLINSSWCRGTGVDWPHQIRGM